MIALSHREPFARGRKRLVFEHPDDPGLVIKVFRPKFAAPAPGWAPWQGLRRYYVCVHMVLREMREHIEARRDGGVLPSFVPRIVGLADTDLGLGVVVEAARGGDGGFAPTLKSMLQAGQVDAQAVADLRRFCAEIEACELVIGDMHAGNVVYACDADGGARFMLVDGLGDKTLVPLLKMSRLLARRARRRKTRRLLAAVERQGAGGRDAPQA